jgi:hypothetical protein
LVAVGMLALAAFTAWLAFKALATATRDAKLPERRKTKAPDCNLTEEDA